jgi:hypothetical protein
MDYSAHGTLIDYSPVSLSSPAQPQRVSINIPLGKQQPSSSSPSTPRLTAAVPTSSTTHAPTSASPNPASTPTSKSIAALESMLTTLASRPSAKIDRLASVRAAKAAIQGGQLQASQSRPGPHPLPPRPSVAPVMGGGSNSGSTGGGPSGGGGGGGGPSM